VVHPFLERRLSIAQWKTIAVVNVIESPSILKYAQQLESRGLRGKDALHIACALETGCECLLTTDDQIVKIMDNDDEIRVMNPTVFVTTMEPYS